MKRILSYTHIIITSLFLLLMIGITTSCVKECLDDSACIKKCECQATGGDTGECNIGFRCLVDGSCGEAYDDLSCDQICQNYAARGYCGSQHCVDSLDCKRTTTCDSSDPQTGELLRTDTCDSTFGCDTVLGRCVDDYYQKTDNELCQECVTGQ